MRVVLDALPASYGGIATYTEHLVAAWATTHPDDELHVLLPRGSQWWPLPAGVVRHDLAVGRGQAARALAVTRELPRLVERVGAEAVLAANPATTLRRLGVPLAVVVHDLRHELRPDQFPLVRRTVRRVSHRHGYRTADVVIAVSERTKSDLLQRCPRLPATRIVVVHEGGDHVARWARGAATGAAVASCHHSNKDTDAMLEAWCLLGPDGPPLRLLGLSGARAAPVQARIAELALDDRVSVSPYLPETEFQHVMTGARLVVFVSDFEGFGLPVVEAMQLRLPLVIGPEPACLEVAGGHAVVTADWSPEALADAVRRAVVRPATEIEDAGRYADGFTWARTATSVRDALRDAISGRARPSRAARP